MSNTRWIKGCSFLLALLLVASQSVMAWTYTDIAGCQFLVDASKIVGLADGDAVATWTDLSGAGHDATQSVALTRPHYKTGIINGKAVVRFTTSNGSYLSTSAFTMNQPSTVCMVVKQADTGSYVYMDGSPNWSRVIGYFSPNVHVIGGVNLTQAITDPTAFAVICGVYNGASASINSYNGTTVTGNAGTAASAGVWLGCNSGHDTCSNSDNAITVAYDSALSAGNRAKVEGCMAWTYGLEGNLPVGHTYKSTNPCPAGASKRRILNAAFEPFDLDGLTPWIPDWIDAKVRGYWWALSAPFICPPGHQAGR